MKQYIPVIISFFLIMTGLILGALNFKLNLRALHISIGLSFLFIVTLGTYKHLKKIYTNSTSYIGWFHIIMFSLILFISTRMLKAWGKSLFKSKPKKKSKK